MPKRANLLDKLVVVNFKYFEAFLLVGFAIIEILSFIQYRQVPIRIEYIPNAVTGFTTLSGILTAFVGFWVARQHENPGDEETRKWMQERSITMITVIVVGLLIVAGGLSSLVYQSLEFALQLSILGTLMIIWAASDVLFFQIFASMSFEKKEKHATSAE
jgi:hypothetical protein